MNASSDNPAERMRGRELDRASHRLREPATGVGRQRRPVEGKPPRELAPDRGVPLTRIAACCARLERAS